MTRSTRTVLQQCWQRMSALILLALSLLALSMIFAPNAQAAVSYVSQDTEVISVTNDNSVRLNTPTGTAAGDLLIAQMVVRSTVTVTAPSGWTLLLGPLTNGTARTYLFYRFVPAGGLGNQDFTFSGNSRAVTGMVVLRGADSVNPISAYGTATGAGTTATAPSRPVAVDGSYVVAFFAGENGDVAFNNTTLGTSPAWSFASTGGTGGNGVAGAALHRAAATAGSSGTTTAGYSNNDWLATTVVISGGTQQCFSDLFNRTSGLGNEWATSSSSGSFGAPQIVNNRLRMTDNSAEVATAATLQRLFPADGNYVRLEFTLHAYGGSGADGIAVAFSDATVTPQAGGYGGSLGYAQRSGIDGFAGGWLGIGLDEYGNFLNTGEGRGTGGGTPGTNCVNGTTLRSDSVSLRGSGNGTTGYRCLAATNTLSPGVDQANSTTPHRYRVTIDARNDSSIPVTIERDTTGAGTSYSTLISVADVKNAVGQSAIPDNFYLSFTGSTGGSSNYHEIDSLSVCATKLDPVGVQIDHFRIETDGEGLTCAPETITLRACLNSDCSQTYVGNVTATLTGTGWVGGNTVNFSGGSTSVQLQRTTVGSVAIGVSASNPPLKPLAVNRCFNGSTSVACSINFVSTGFLFDAPNVTANKPSGLIEMRAVKASDSLPVVCTPSLQNQSRTLKFFSSYLVPNSGTLSAGIRPEAAAGFTTIANTSPGTDVALNFDNNGRARFELRYPDAGLMRLTSTYTGSVATGDSGLVITGSDDYVALPAGYCIQPMQLANNTLPYTTACNTIGTCGVYQRAGRAFPLRVRAMQWQNDSETDEAFCDNSVTPNFRTTDAGTSYGLIPTMVETSKRTDGNLGVNTLAISSGGGTTITNQTLSDIGRFRIGVAPNSQFFGFNVASLQSNAASRSAVFGRIAPDTFAVTLDDTGSFLPSCSGNFTYAGITDGGSTTGKMGQPIPLTVSVRAQNALSPAGVTLNYDQAVLDTVGTRYARWHDTAPPLLPSPSGRGVFAFTETLSFSNGQSSQSLASLNYQYLLANSPANNAPMNVAATLMLTDADNTIGSDSTVARAFRIGRAVLESAYGQGALPLNIPLRTEYFDGSRWRHNDLDNCTEYNHTDATRDLFTGSLNASNTEFDRPTADQLVVNGSANPSQPLRLEAPGEGQQGSVRITLAVPNWLKYDWNASGGVINDDPQATASFGRYRGSDRIIYWREELPSTP